MSSADSISAGNRSGSDQKPPARKTAPSRKELAAELRLYADLYDHAPLGYFTLDAGRTIRSVNSTGAALLGRDRPALLGLCFDELVCEPSLESSSELFRTIGADSGKAVCELSLKRDAQAPLLVRIDAIACKGGAEFRLAVVDITERKRSEEALQASETRYRRLFESAKDGIIIVDAQSGEITEVNPFLVDMLGWPRADLLGRKLWEFPPLEAVAGNRTEFEVLLHRDYYQNDDLRLVSRDNRTMAVQLVSSSYHVNQSRMLQLNLRDITVRKNAEEALVKSEEQCRTIVSNINEYVYSVRLEQGEIKSVYHSPKCFDITGFTPEEYYQDPLL